MAAPSVTWNRTYIMGNSGASPLDTPITPVATTLITTTAGTYGSNANESTFSFAPTVTGNYGGRVVFGASRDFTVQPYIAFQCYHGGFPFDAIAGASGPSSVVDTLANGGISIVFFDSLGNYSEFNIYGNEYKNFVSAFGGWQGFQSAGIIGTLQVTIDRLRTPDSTSGTLDWTDVAGFEFIMRAINTDSGVELRVGSILLHDEPTLINGDVATPAALEDLHDEITATDSNFQQLAVFRQGDGLFSGSPGTIFEPRYEYRIGDGSTSTYFRDVGSLLAEYPEIDTFGAPTSGLLLSQSAGLVINTSATDDIEFNGSILSSFNAAGGISKVDVTGNTSGSVVFIDTPFYTKEFVNLRHASCSGAIFDDCEAVRVTTDTSVAGSIVRNSSATSSGVEITTGAGDYSSLDFNFKASNTGYDITAGNGGAGTYTVTGVSIEAGHTLSLRNNSATNAITFSIPNISYTTSTAGGSISVVTPVDTLTVDSSETGSQIIVFTTGTQTELDSEASASQLQFQHSGQTVDITVMKAGYIPFRQTGLVLSGDQTITANLVASREYDSSHGLTYTTDASWSRTNNQLTVPTFGPTAQGVFSLMLDSFISESTLRNTAFNIEMDGANSLYLTKDAEGATDASIENMTEAGVGYISTAGVDTAQWSGIKSVGTATGFQGEYQQVDGSGTTDARATGAFNEIIKVYGDASHGNFDYRGYLVLKYQVNGYYQSRADVLDSFGISTLTPTLYIVAMEPAATGITTGDPAITITITDHTAAPITVGGKSFDYEIVGGANSAEDILREINYNLSLDATYQGKDPFNWPDLVIESGGSYESQRGFVEGQDTTTTFHGVYVSQSGGDHPGFSRFQSNDGTYYTPAVLSSISITGLTDDSAAGNTRLQIHNEDAKTASAWAATTAYAQGDKVLRSTGTGSERTAGLYFVATTAGTTGGTEPTWDTVKGNTTADGTVTWTCYDILYYDADPAGTSYADSYTDGEEFSAGDTFRIRFADMDAGNTYKDYETTGVVSSTGFTVAANPTADSVYATNAVDGSTRTEFTADYTDTEIDVSSDTDSTPENLYAWYAYTLTTSEGMYNFWGAITAIDTGNYRNNSSVASLKIDNTTTGSVSLQGSGARLFRDDGVNPEKIPTTSGFGVSITWELPVYAFDGGGGGFTSGDRATLNATATQSSVNTVDTNVDAVLADTNELQANQGQWATATGFATPTDVSASTSTIQADIAALDAVVDTKASQSSVDLVTDDLALTATKTITENVEGENYTEVAGGTTKTIVKAGSITTVTPS